MTFQLQPGDYVMASDIENEEMHNAIREAFRKAKCEIKEIYALYGENKHPRDGDCVGWYNETLLWMHSGNSGLVRRVYPHQILSKPMLIEALKPGMRAKLLTGTVRHNESGFVKWESTSEYCNHATLTTTEYEIIPDDPKPWEATMNDKGWIVDQGFGVQGSALTYPMCLRTKQAAEHMAKIMRVYTAIMNMPGAYDGNNAHVWYDDIDGMFYPTGEKPEHLLNCPFDTYENAKAAAKEANRIIEEME